MESKTYGLSLSDDNCWQLRSSDSNLNFWMDQFATIMELKETKKDDSRKLHFSQFRTEKEVLTSSSEKMDLNQLPEYNTQYIRTCRWNGDPDILCEINNEDNSKEVEYVNMFNALYPIYRNSILKGGLPVHAALLEIDRKGVIIAAAGGTGKSTCYRRIPSPWKPLCDDEVLIVYNSATKQYRAHPFPTWSDYLMNRCKPTWNVQYSVPLYGVFFLEQSRIDDVIHVGQGESLMRMIASAYQACHRFYRRMSKSEESQFRKVLFENAHQLARVIPAYRLKASLEGMFWQKIEPLII